MSKNGVYWFLSLPPDASLGASLSIEDKKSNIFSKVKEKGTEFGEVFKVMHPDFKVGTLDQLVLVSDELSKMDTQFEGIVTKTAAQLKGMLKEGENISNHLIVTDNKTPDAYLKSFTWNTMKYRSDRPINEIAALLQQEITQIDTLIKNKVQAYSQVKGQVASIDRKAAGNLLVKPLGDFVRKEHFVLDSEYLETLLVVVPKFMQNQWLNRYETLTAMVVPRSSTLITEDNDFCLYNVTVFKKVANEFKDKAREEKYQVREFTFDTEQLGQEKTQFEELSSSFKEQAANLIRLLKTNFGEAFSCWIHLKVLRVFVESLLRYGLPPVFQAMVFKPKPKLERKLREWLTNGYMSRTSFANASHLTTSPTKGAENETQLMEEAGGLLNDREYYSFVYFPLTWDLTSKE